MACSMWLLGYTSVDIIVELKPSATLEPTQAQTSAMPLSLMAVQSVDHLRRSNGVTRLRIDLDELGVKPIV